MDLSPAEWLVALLVALVVIPLWIYACWFGWLRVANEIMERTGRFWPGVVLLPVAVVVFFAGCALIFGVTGWLVNVY